MLLGSLARIPMGMLTDRFGGRAVFAVLMAVVAAPRLDRARSRPATPQLLTVAFFLGLAGSSFAIGVGYVSRWTPPEQQGSALGVYGLGNIGQSAAVFLGPVLAARDRDGSRSFAASRCCWWSGPRCLPLLARNAPRAARRAAPDSAPCCTCSRAKSSPGCWRRFTS